MIFSKVTYHSNLGTTPARVNRKTGELQINLPVWEKLSPEEKRFVELHEEGHLVLQTRNELAADRYAFKKYAEEGHSLKAGVKALTNRLQDKPTHLIRSLEVLKQAAKYQKQKSMEKENLFFTPAWDNFLGFGKKARERREEKREAKHEAKLEKIALKVDKMEDKNERKNTRTDANAEQKVLLAQQGLSAGGMLAQGLGAAVGNIGNTVASVASGGLSSALGGLASPLPQGAPYTNLPTYSSAEKAMSAGPTGTSFQQAYESETASGYDPSIIFSDPAAALTGKDKAKALPWIIGGVLAVVVVLALIFRK